MYVLPLMKACLSKHQSVLIFLYLWPVFFWWLCVHRSSPHFTYLYVSCAAPSDPCFPLNGIKKYPTHVTYWRSKWNQTTCKQGFCCCFTYYQNHHLFFLLCCFFVHFHYQIKADRSCCCWSLSYSTIFPRLSILTALLSYAILNE